MNCLVIGGQGFLGRAIVNELEKEGNDVTVADRTLGHDITDFKSIKELIRGRDEVYHMAGILGTSEMNRDIHNSITVNILGTVNVLEACRQTGVPRLFYPSKPNVWLNTYSVTKQAAEDFAQLYNKNTDLKVICLRYFNAYGAGQHTHPVRKIIPTFAIETYFKKPVEIYGSGENIVDMIDARDIAKYSVAATRAELNDTIYDLGRGIEISVREVAFDVLDITHGSVKYIPMRAGEVEPTVLVANVDKLLSRLGMNVFLPWEDSLREAIDYYHCLPEYELREAYEFLHHDKRTSGASIHLAEPTGGNT